MWNEGIHFQNTTFIDHIPFVETVLGSGRKSYYWGR